LRLLNKPCGSGTVPVKFSASGKSVLNEGVSVLRNLRHSRSAQLVIALERRSTSSGKIVGTFTIDSAPAPDES